jgi:protease-4
MKSPKKHITAIVVSVVGIVVVILILAYHNYSISTCANAVRFIPIVGDITNAQNINLNSTTTPEADEKTILSELQSANNDPSVKAIVLLIDSNGGDPETAEEIVQEMSHIQKPKLALIRGNGDSAAYWIASAADKIYAFPTSDVGDIGVTDSYVSDAQQNTQNGLQFISLTSGQFKDTGNPDKPVTQADKNILMKGVTNLYNLFVSAVSANRHIPIAQVTALANGSSVLGDEALQDGLIDSTGGWDALWQQLDTYLHNSCYSVE